LRLIVEKICPLCFETFFCYGNCNMKEHIDANACFCPSCVAKSPNHSWLYEPSQCPRLFQKEYLKEDNPSRRMINIKSSYFLLFPKLNKVYCPFERKKVNIVRKCFKCFYFLEKRAGKIYCSSASVKDKKKVKENE